MEKGTAMTAIGSRDEDLPAGMGVFGSERSFSLAIKAAMTFAASAFVPDAFKAERDERGRFVKDKDGNIVGWQNCLIAIDQAARLRMNPLMIMQNMYIVNGKPSWSSSFLIGLINRSGKYDQPLQFETKTDAKGNPESCRAWTMQGGAKITGPVVTMEMARKEGWLDKKGSKWQTMPGVMIQYRAASFFARMNCPEVTMGLRSNDEEMEAASGMGPARELLADMVREGTMTETIGLPEPPQEEEAQPGAMPQPEPPVSEEPAAGAYEAEALDQMEIPF